MFFCKASYSYLFFLLLPHKQSEKNISLIIRHYEKNMDKHLNLIVALFLALTATSLTPVWAQHDTTCNELCQYVQDYFDHYDGAYIDAFWNFKLPDSIENKYFPKDIYFSYTDYPYGNHLICYSVSKPVGKYAFFDLSGNQLTPFLFEEFLFAAGESPLFKNGVLRVKKSNKNKRQFAILKEDMSYAVPFGHYDEISSQTNSGFFVVGNHNKYGIINAQLDTVLPITHQRVVIQDLFYFIVVDEGQYRILDSVCHPIGNLVFDSLYLLSKERVAAYKNDTLYMISPDYDIVRQEFDKVVIPTDPFIFAPEGELIVSKEGKEGVVDSNYRTIIPVQYEKILYDQSFEKFYYVRNHGKWAAFNKNGQQITDFLYDWIDGYSNEDESATFLVVKNDKFGKIDQNGNELIPCVYDAISFLRENVLGGHYVIKDNRMGFVDDRGVRIPTEYDFVHIVNMRWALVSNNNLLGIWDLQGDSLAVPVQYRYFYSETSGDTMQIAANDNGHWKLIDVHNQPVDNPDKLLAIIKNHHLRNADFFTKDHYIENLIYLRCNHNVYIPENAHKILKDFIFPHDSNEAFYYKME